MAAGRIGEFLILLRQILETCSECHIKSISLYCFYRAAVDQTAKVFMSKNEVLLVD